MPVYVVAWEKESDGADGDISPDPTRTFYTTAANRRAAANWLAITTPPLVPNDLAMVWTAWEFDNLREPRRIVPRGE